MEKRRGAEAEAKAKESSAKTEIYIPEINQVSPRAGD
jgi:hypothetical protein